MGWSRLSGIVRPPPPPHNCLCSREPVHKNLPGPAPTAVGFNTESGRTQSAILPLALQPPLSLSVAVWGIQDVASRLTQEIVKDFQEHHDKYQYLWSKAHFDWFTLP